MCYTLIQSECFQSFRYARRRSEVTVNDRLSAAAPISFSMLKVRRLLGRGAYFNGDMVLMSFCNKGGAFICKSN